MGVRMVVDLLFVVQIWRLWLFYVERRMIFLPRGKVPRSQLRDAGSPTHHNELDGCNEGGNWLSFDFFVTDISCVGWLMDLLQFHLSVVQSALRETSSQQLAQIQFLPLCHRSLWQIQPAYWNRENSGTCTSWHRDITTIIVCWICGKRKGSRWSGHEEWNSL